MALDTATWKRLEARRLAANDKAMLIRDAVAREAFAVQSDAVGEYLRAVGAEPVAASGLVAGLEQQLAGLLALSKTPTTATRPLSTPPPAPSPAAAPPAQSVGTSTPATPPATRSTFDAYQAKWKASTPAEKAIYAGAAIGGVLLLWKLLK